jgi:F0F1-type ATP synthase membrane subunit b/b'
LRKLEEQHALEEKKRKQDEIRDMYGKSLQMKQKKQAREMQEQLAFDLKILEQLLEESRNEAMEQVQRKVRDCDTNVPVCMR